MNQRGKESHCKPIERKQRSHSYRMYEMVWDIPVVKNKVHPTEKPDELFRRLIKIVTQGKPETLIIDPFCGSNVTGKICNELGIKCETSDNGGWKNG